MYVYLNKCIKEIDVPSTDIVPTLGQKTVLLMVMEWCTYEYIERS